MLHFRFGRTSFRKGTTHIDNKGWQWFRFVVFDNPEPTKHKQPFEDRYKSLLNGIPYHHAVVAVSPRMKCTDYVHIFLLSYLSIPICF
jgi:hypothetical protein